MSQLRTKIFDQIKINYNIYYNTVRLKRVKLQCPYIEQYTINTKINLYG